MTKPSPVDLIEAFIEHDTVPKDDLRVAVLMLTTAYRDLRYGLACLIDPREPEPDIAIISRLLHDVVTWEAVLDAPLQVTQPIGA